MIITQTPVRISFFGGGTDYPSYFKEHGGETLATTINKYTIVTIHPLNPLADCAFRVFYSKVESVRSADEIEHASARECLKFLKIDRGVEIHYVSDLPARTGIGSSSSATVGLLLALHAYKGEMVSQAQLAEEAVYVEQELIKERVGCQDQYACALGGLLHLEFHKDGSVGSSPVVVPAERRQDLERRLLLVYTGRTRFAHDVLEEQIERTNSGENKPNLDRMRKHVRMGADVLSSGRDLREFGELLHESWMLKRGLSSRISNSDIDDAYERARKAGCVGGKLLGAGGGGFLLLYVEPERREAVRSALGNLREAEFALENTGAKVIYFRS